MFRRLLVVVPILTAILCLAQPQKVELRVALFPYIPDAHGDKFQSLTERLKREFEQRYDATVSFRPLNPVDDDFYDIETLKSWLGSGGVQYDLVEIDAILLGELSDTKLIAPWGRGIRDTDWHATARDAVTIFGDVYGVPHLQCGHFVFSMDERVTSAKNITELTDAIRRSKMGGGRFAADILGSWNTPALYLDAWQDSHASLRSSGLLAPLDERIVTGIGGLVRLCAADGRNPCMTGAYKGNDVAATLLGENKITATIGYSERLHPVLKSLKQPERLHLASAPLGAGNSPLLFTDAIVKRSGCVAECEKAATAFAQYLLEPATQEWMLMARDKPQITVPRYLLPATASAYEQPGLRGDRFYGILRKLTENARAYPSFGLYAVRSAFRDALMARLTEATKF